MSPTEIVMPRLSDTMEEGTILRWLKRDGERVSRGEELVEIETDKASMTYESDQEGVLEILAGEGDTLAIGAVIARVGTGVAEPPAAPPPPPRRPRRRPLRPSRQRLPTQAPRRAPRGPRHRASDSRPRRLPGAWRTSRGWRSSRSRAAARAGGSCAPTSKRPRATALLRHESPRSPLRLRRRRAAPAPAQAPAVAPARAGAIGASPGPAEVLTAKGQTATHELSRTQQLIARRMAESKATIPHFTIEIEVDMEGCVAMRAELAQATTSSAVPTYNDMVVKACALALREHPRVNASYRDGAIQVHSRVNVGVAVAVEPEDPMQGALVVPTVFDTEIKSLGEVARETRALAERVRTAAITPPELSGGTFTVSNLGMYGVRSFAAIINPPQVAILSVGALAPRAVVRDGEVVPRHTLAATLACDHRVLYGADAARFLARVRDLLELPAALTL